jgi:hypothetical protein
VPVLGRAPSTASWELRRNMSVTTAARSANLHRLEELVTSPGVARKTANPVLGDAFGKPGITVNTHVARLARRFGWTAHTNPDKIERDVAALLPRKEWTAASHRLIWHGCRVCHARRPAVLAGSPGGARRSAWVRPMRRPRASSSRPGRFRDWNRTSAEDAAS